MYSAVDGAVHLAEEVSNATKAIPRAMLSTWIIGFVTTFTFAIAMMYTGEDFEAIAETPTLYGSFFRGFSRADCVFSVPLYELLNQATRSTTAATVFLTFIDTLAMIALIGALQVSEICSFRLPD